MAALIAKFGNFIFLGDPGTQWYFHLHLSGSEIGRFELMLAKELELVFLGDDYSNHEVRYRTRSN